MSQSLTLPARRIQLLVPLLITAGLALDQKGGAWAQPLVVIATWLAFLWMLRSGDAGTRAMMLLCLTYATVGEVLLSLVWRVYEYRLGNLPLFVPPGHVLLFLLGVTIAPRVTDAMVTGVATAAALVVAVLALTGRDTLSVLLVTVFLASVVFGRERRLYAAMFVLALAMELYGTLLGNWHWAPLVGRTGMVTLNPPMAAGAFYCALDLLVMWSVRGLSRTPTRIVPAALRVQV
jgi:hypothetical protein